MSADGSPHDHQRGTFATGRISRTRPWTDDNPVLERAYTQGGSHAAKALLPWRSIAAISRQASVLGLRAPDKSMLARQRENTKLARVFPNTAALDEPISPRERVRIVLRLAGAPMVPRAVADRLRMPLAEAAALFQALADDGEIITVAVGDRQGLITLRHMPEPTATDSLRAARHHGSRIAPAARRTPHAAAPAAPSARPRRHRHRPAESAADHRGALRRFRPQRQKRARTPGSPERPRARKDHHPRRQRPAPAQGPPLRAAPGHPRTVSEPTICICCWALTLCAPLISACTPGNATDASIETVVVRMADGDGYTSVSHDGRVVTVGCPSQAEKAP